MDTLLCPYRLKTARRKKQLQIKHQDKQLIQKEREYEQLLDIQRHEPMVALDKPYQRGWVRGFELIPEVQNSDKAAFYQEILDRINTWQWHHDEQFKPPKRKRCWRRYDYKELPRLQTIGRYHWHHNTARLSDEQRACFKRVEFWSDHLYKWDYYYQFAQPELFEIRVKPKMITHIKQSDAELQQQINFLNSILYNSASQYRLQKIKGGYYKYWRSRCYIEKPQYINPLKNKPLHRVLEEYC